MWKSFTGFVDRLAIANFFSEIACAIGFGYTRLPSNHESFPVNYSLVLQLQNLNDLQYTV